MHPQAVDLMGHLLRKYGSYASGKRLLDVGAGDINGTYRPLCEELGYEYFGADVEAGPNVDVELPIRGDWMLTDKWDVVICGQTLEHSERPWKLVGEMAAVCESLLILIAPWQWPEHHHPLDCWRILPDGMRVLLMDAGFQLLETGKTQYESEHGIIGDCYGAGLRL